MSDFDFIKDIDDWTDSKHSFENPAEPCCLYLISSEEGITHESFATRILTKSQIQRMPGAEKAKNNEINNLKVLMHLRLLPMMVRPDGW